MEVILETLKVHRVCDQRISIPQILALGRGVGYCRPNNYFQYTLWVNAGNDLRRDTETNWIEPQEKILYNNPASKYFGQPVQIEFTNPYDTSRAWYGWQHYKLYVPNEPTVGQPAGGNGDWYLFRLAETYLLRAEAYVWKDDFNKAAEDINKVRERSLAPSITAAEGNIRICIR
jgi:starch-binding outer membrane protein, SusD/RagB family